MSSSCCSCNYNRPNFIPVPGPRGPRGATGPAGPSGEGTPLMIIPFSSGQPMSLTTNADGTSDALFAIGSSANSGALELTGATIVLDTGNNAAFLLPAEMVMTKVTATFFASADMVLDPAVLLNAAVYIASPPGNIFTPIVASVLDFGLWENVTAGDFVTASVDLNTTIAENSLLMFVFYITSEEGDDPQLLPGTVSGGIVFQSPPI